MAKITFEISGIASQYQNDQRHFDQLKTEAMEEFKNMCLVLMRSPAIHQSVKFTFTIIPHAELDEAEPQAHRFPTMAAHGSTLRLSIEYNERDISIMQLSELRRFYDVIHQIQVPENNSSEWAAGPLFS
jgi:hypothetical protein